MNDKTYSYFKFDEQLKKRHEDALPTEEMYRYFPTKNEYMLIEKEEKECYRYIFNGSGVPYTNFEEQKYRELLSYIKKKEGNIKYPEFWLESDTRRLLQAGKYDDKDSYKLIKENIEWTRNYKDKLTDRMKTILNYGMLYTYGRDIRFRPILIIELKKVNELIDKKYSFDEINDTLIYFMKYAITYLFVPGQIENWIIITDFDDIGLGSIGTFKKVLGTLNRYRGRVYKNFMLNLGSFLGGVVENAVSLFSSQSAKKMKILNEKEFKEIHKFIRPDNIQKKYGGTAPDIVPGGNNLFPPIFPSKSFYNSNNKPKFKTEDEYREMCLNSKPFKPFTIDPRFLEKIKEQQEKEEKERELQRQKEQEELDRKQKEKELKANAEKERMLNKQKSLAGKGINVRSFANKFHSLSTLGSNKAFPVPKQLDLNLFTNFFNKVQNHNGMTVLK